MLFRLLCVIFLSLGSFLSYGAIILKVRNNQCLIHLEGASAGVGDYFKALDIYGNISGIVQIKKIKNNKAIANIVEGTAGTNWILEPTKQPTLTAQKASSPSIQSNSNRMIGFLPHASFNFARKKHSTSDRLQRFRGYGGGGSVFFNYGFRPMWAMDFQLGAAYYQVKDYTFSRENDCRLSDCHTWIWWFPQGKISVQFKTPVSRNVQIWMSGGAALSYWGRNDENYELAKDTAFERPQISGHLAIGSYINIAPGVYIPISLEYSQVQAFSHLLTNFSKSGNNNDPVYVSQVSFQIGISKSL